MMPADRAAVMRAVEVLLDLGHADAVFTVERSYAAGDNVRVSVRAYVPPDSDTAAALRELGVAGLAYRTPPTGDVNPPGRNTA